MRGLLRLAGLILLFSAPLRAATPSCEDLCAEATVRGYGYLLASTGFTGTIEHAAFVVKKSDGSIRFIRWMSNHEYRAEYDGSIPEHCIGLAHTHPRGLRQPSPHDVDEARKLGLPIIVITTDAITVARADGEVEALFGAGWTNGKR